MNSYRYILDETIRPHIIEKLSLNKLIINSLIIAIALPIIMFFIIANILPERESMAVAVFVLIITAIGVLLDIIKRNNILKGILKANHVQWDDTKIIFLQNDNVLKEWRRESTQVAGTSSSALYLVSGKSSLKLEYMVIGITVDSPDDIKDLAKSFIST